ncbi:MAG: DUF1656 domain-containing protein [Gammaproteobacteria bacterium]
MLHRLDCLKLIISWQHTQYRHDLAVPTIFIKAIKVIADCEIQPMLSEIMIAHLYIPPFLLYVGVAALVYGLLERALRRWLDWAWHPSLARFFVSLIVLSTLVLSF